MSKEKKNKNTKKAEKTSKSFIQSTKKADGTEEYYIKTAPQKTLGGKIIIWILVGLMVLGSIGGLIVALINISK